MTGKTTTAAPNLRQGLQQALRSLLIYKGIWEEPVLQSFRSLVVKLGPMGKAGSHGLAKESDTPSPGEQLVTAYYTFLSELLEGSTGTRPGNGVGVGSFWQEHLLGVILGHTSPVIQALCQRAQETAEASAHRLHIQVLEHDLALLSRLFWAFDDGLDELIREAMGDISLPADGILNALYGRLVEGELWRCESKLTSDHVLQYQGKRAKPLLAEAILESEALYLRRQFYATRKWADMAPTLVDYHRRFGTGQFARCAAFLWSSTPGEGLVGVDVTDPIQLEELSGYGEQVQKVTENTGRFLKGLPAHNLLLYGDRGTGKSSTVKGLIHRFVAQGLRLVEVGREELSGLGELVKSLSRSSLKFIVFIDDLSFEESETEFKALKSVLEGSVVRQPENVRIYATSNRRHLIKESFSDTNAGGEVRLQDTVQEKLSLSDRFGLTIIYPSPDQKTYLSIVEHLAAMEGLCIGKEELKARALQWTLWHNERSGRTARQFMDELKAELQIQG